jgi:hypothetical protein
VSIKQKLRNVLLSVSLAMAVVAGAPMRPEEIEDLLLQVNQPKIAHTLPARNDDGDDPIKKLLGETLESA